jgi:hypothetical protein
MGLECMEVSVTWREGEENVRWGWRCVGVSRALELGCHGGGGERCEWEEGGRRMAQLGTRPSFLHFTTS